MRERPSLSIASKIRRDKPDLLSFAPAGGDVFALSLLPHARFQQAMERGEVRRQIPASEWHRLIQGADFLLQQREVVQRIEDHVRFLVGAPVAGDDLGAAAGDHLVDIAPDLNVMMGIGDRHGIVVAAEADHRDRRRPRADLVAGVVRDGR